MGLQQVADVLAAGRLHVASRTVVELSPADLGVAVKASLCLLIEVIGCLKACSLASCWYV